jgi:hypothetical protein
MQGGLVGSSAPFWQKDGQGPNYCSKLKETFDGSFNASSGVKATAAVL